MQLCEVKSLTIYYHKRTSEKKTVYFTFEDLNSGEVFTGVTSNENLPTNIFDILNRNLFVLKAEKPLEKKSFYTKFNPTTKSVEKIPIDQFHITKVCKLNEYVNPNTADTKKKSE